MKRLALRVNRILSNHTASCIVIPLGISQCTLHTCVLPLYELSPKKKYVYF